MEEVILTALSCSLSRALASAEGDKSEEEFVAMRAFRGAAGDSNPLLGVLESYDIFHSAAYFL